MIASADLRYDARRRASTWPATVREPVVAEHSYSDPVPAPRGPNPGRDESGKDPDELYRLGERIAELAERINAAEARMMTLIADFDRRGGWRDRGFSSCAEWLAWRIGIKIGPARERVRTARALENLPQTADALAGGSISYAKVRALTRVATPEREAELLEFARAGSAAKLERTVRMWRMLSRDEELTAEQARHRSRAFSVFVDGDGMYVVKGRLEPEAGAVLMRAVEAASDALFRREGAARAGGHEDDSDAGGRVGDGGDARPEPKRRRADAVGLLAERALAAGFEGRACLGARNGSGSSGDADDGSRDSDNDSRDSDSDPRGNSGAIAAEPDGGFGELARDPAEPNAARTYHSAGASRRESLETPGDDPRNAVSASPRIDSGTRAERYQVMVHCDAATLAAEGEPGRSDLDGIRVSAEPPWPFWPPHGRET